MNTKKIKISIAIVIVVITVLLLQGMVTRSKKSFLYDMITYTTKPIGAVFSNAGWWFRDKIIFLTSIGDLKNDNQKLFDNNLELKAKIARLLEVEKENETLRREINLAPRKKYNLEMSLVIGRESGSYSEVIYINKGKDDDIRTGMAVLAGKGVLIGRVIEVNKNISKIQLITDKNFKVNAKLVESDGHGVVFGQYGTSVRMKMIPQTVKINKGDTIVTSRLSAKLVPDLLVGYVQEVFNTADGLFQEVTVLLPKELENLHLVQVLKE